MAVGGSFGFEVGVLKTERLRVIQLARVYDSERGGDGARFLVERLWPRGIKKVNLKIDAWLKDVAPSTELRKWFSHDPAKWDDFRQRYFVELRSHPEAWQPILDAARRGTAILLYSSHDEEHNNAAALKEFLEKKLRK